MKKCVFCGLKPDEKTREHIIPQWLIKLTGKANRNINLGINWNHFYKTGEIKERQFTFQSFHFPACKNCNEKYSNLEGNTKLIITKILNNKYITEIEIDILLDWLDKVRIGLWLGFLTLEKDFYGVNPNFSISNRIGKKDRSLTVYKLKDNWKGIRFGGVNLPCFSFNPGCFSLTINNYVFLNLSNDFIFSKNLGFPYPTSSSNIKETRYTEIEFTEGTSKTKNKVYRIPFIFGGTELYQPILFDKCENIINSKNCNYVKEHLLKENELKGKIFIRDYGKIDTLKNNEEICLTPEKEFERKEFTDQLFNFLIKFQVQLLTYNSLLKRNETIDKKEIKKLQKIQILLLKHRKK